MEGPAQAILQPPAEHTQFAPIPEMLCAPDVTEGTAVAVRACLWIHVQYVSLSRP